MGNHESEIQFNSVPDLFSHKFVTQLTMTDLWSLNVIYLTFFSQEPDTVELKYPRRK